MARPLRAACRAGRVHCSMLALSFQSSNTLLTAAEQLPAVSVLRQQLVARGGGMHALPRAEDGGDGAVGQRVGLVLHAVEQLCRTCVFGVVHAVGPSDDLPRIVAAHRGTPYPIERGTGRSNRSARVILSALQRSHARPPIRRPAAERRFVRASPGADASQHRLGRCSQRLAVRGIGCGSGAALAVEVGDSASVTKKALRASRSRPASALAMASVVQSSMRPVGNCGSFSASA